jgi:predicted TIM-barrel fold metal-dependent hydrolase
VVAGSDYPHLIGSIKGMRESIGSLELSEADERAILWANARELYGL